MGNSSRMPTIATGTTGTPALMAIYAGPSLNSRSPSAERPPSGKFNTETLRSLMMRAACIMLFNEARGFERSTGMCPARSQVRAQQGDAEQSLLGEKAELLGQYGKQRRNIHEAAVIGHEHVSAARVQLFRPSTRTRMKLTASSILAHIRARWCSEFPEPIEERSDQRERSHHDGADDDQGRGEQQGAERDSSIRPL